MTYDYFYGQQSDLFTFYRVPKVLFTNERFWNISADAKMLYGISILLMAAMISPLTIEVWNFSDRELVCLSLMWIRPFWTVLKSCMKQNCGF